MSRIVQLLAGATVAAAASANLACSGSDGANCSSCVGTGVAQVCAMVMVPPVIVCAGGCPTAVIGAGAIACSAATTPTSACSVCVPVITANALSLGVGACVATTAQVAVYLTANSTLNAALNAGASIQALAGMAVVKANLTASAGATAAQTVLVDAGNNIIDLAAASSASASAAVNINVNGNANSYNIFQVNSSLNVGVWSNVGTAQVNNNNNVVLQVSQLSLSGSASAGGSASATSDFLVAQQTGASTTFGNIDFGASSSTSMGSSGSSSSTVQVAGGTAHFGGSAAAGGNAAGVGAVANITGSGYIQLSSGVSVDGSLPASATVTVDNTGSNAALASIEAQTSFNVAGDILASTNGAQSSANANAVIAVNGALTVSGSVAKRVQPKVVLTSGASFVINTTARFQADAVNVGAGATLAIGSAVDRTQVTISQVAQCAGAIQIKLSVSADAFIAANANSDATHTTTGATSNVGFSYGNNNVNELIKCNVQVIDANGVTYNLDARTAAQASAGRRLLASNGQATYSDNQMTFSMQKQQSSAAVSFAVVPLLMVSMAGLLF